MTTSPRARWFLALLAAFAATATACGKAEEADYPSPPPTDPSVRSPAAPMTVSHVLIGMAGAPNTKSTRSKDSALVLAKEVIADFKAGRRSWQDLVDRFSDDKDEAKGVANSANMVDRRDKSTLPPGTYVINEFTDFVPPFKEAVKKLGVGEVTPEPVETQFGYHVIRRVK